MRKLIGQFPVVNDDDEKSLTQYNVALLRINKCRPLFKSFTDVELFRFLMLILSRT